jgi:hypothetical protein
VPADADLALLGRADALGTPLGRLQVQQTVSNVMIR